MDPLDILFSVRPDSRGTVQALHEMGICAVITKDGLQLMNGDASSSLGGGSPHAVGDSCHPRDHLGQPVDYWVLSLEIQTDLSDLGEYYPPNWLEELPEIN